MSSLSNIQRASFGINTPSDHRVAFAGLPWSISVENNHVLSRAMVETLGMDSGPIIMARNRYERIEKAWDSAMRWMGVFIIPLLIAQVVSRAYARTVLKTPNALPMRVPFAWLEQRDFTTRMKTFARDPEKRKELQAFGLKSVNELKQLAPKILKGKLWILFADLALMEAFGQFRTWSKNTLTKKLTGREEFSGTFKEASLDYQREKAEKFKKTKSLRQKISAAIYVTSALTFPLLFRKVLMTPARQGFVARLKKLIPSFEYDKAVYMSKWLIFYAALTNITPATLLSSRDENELRESAVRIGIFDFFFFVGDSIISSVGAWTFSKIPPIRRHLKEPLYRLEKLSKHVAVPIPTHLHTLAKKYGTGSAAYRWAVANFWLGILGTSACVGIFTPMANNWFTRQKVQREERERTMQQATKGVVSSPLKHLSQQSFTQWLQSIDTGRRQVIPS